MTDFPMLAQRIFNRPLAIRPERAEMIIAAVADRLGIARIDPRPAAWSDWDEEPRSSRPYGTVDGIAVIPVQGTLVSRLGGLQPYCGMTGYNQVKGQLMLAMADPAIRAIALDIDSPGGEIDGLFAVVDYIYSVRGQKPMHAICADHGYSSAYALASATDRVTVPRTGGCGSVGVIASICDFSASLEKAGIKTHFIVHGMLKAEALRAAYEGVKPELLERLQVEIDEIGELFCATVARNRGSTPEKIQGLQAACFMGRHAVAAGLADAVLEPDEAFAELQASVSQ